MTNKQKQCLLFYLGYYIGNIDGKLGTLTTLATKAFQKDFGITADGVIGKETEKALTHAVCYGMPVKEVNNDFWKEIKYFKKSEFKCKCGKCGGFPVDPSEELVKLLEQIREHFNAPVTVNSGVRCKAHNAKVGGATGSQHLKGTAADIKVQGVKPSKVAAYAETLLKNTGGIGRYSTFTHVDTRVNMSRWNG